MKKMMEEVVVDKKINIKRKRKSNNERKEKINYNILKESINEEIRNKRINKKLIINKKKEKENSIIHNIKIYTLIIILIYFIPILLLSEIINVIIIYINK